MIHFLTDFFGAVFLALPEVKNVAKLLADENTGIQLLGSLSKDIAELIRQLEHAQGLERVLLLLNCMQKISVSAEQKVITMASSSVNSHEENSVIETIIDYSFKHFLNPISLNEIAGETRMSVPAFCRFFKRNIKKSYFDFIKELRIGQACKLLRETNRPVLEICYSSGYNSWANFSKQFKVVTNTTPSRYRKQYKN